MRGRLTRGSPDSKIMKTAARESGCEGRGLVPGLWSAGGALLVPRAAGHRRHHALGEAAASNGGYACVDMPARMRTRMHAPTHTRARTRACAHVRTHTRTHARAHSRAHTCYAAGDCHVNVVGRGSARMHGARRPRPLRRHCVCRLHRVLLFQVCEKKSRRVCVQSRPG